MAKSEDLRRLASRMVVVAKRTKDPTIAETLSMQAGELLAGRKTSKQAPLLCPATR